MDVQNSSIAINKEWWEKMAAEQNGFTLPWLELDPAVVYQLADGQLKKAPPPLNDIYPLSVLSDVKGKDVLCLASGGGQQSAVFGILGANVTVVDIGDGQLGGDKKAAQHYGYKVTTFQGSMTDLSMLNDNSFDLVYQAPSMGYISDVKQVNTEVARILRSGGLYRADAQDPLAQFIDEFWDGKGYKITVPYAVRERKRAEDKNVIEYRHYIDETFNGLIGCGFTIEGVYDWPPDLYQNGIPEPGNWLHSLLYVPGIFAILARKN